MKTVIVKAPIHFNLEKLLELNGQTFENEKDLMNKIKKLPLSDEDEDEDVKQVSIDNVEVVCLEDFIAELNNEHYTESEWVIYVNLQVW